MKLCSKGPRTDLGIIREGFRNIRLGVNDGTRDLVCESWNERLDRVAPSIRSAKEKGTRQNSIRCQTFG